MILRYIHLVFLVLAINTRLTATFYLIGSTGTLGSYISTHPSCVPLTRSSKIPDDGSLIISASPSEARLDVLSRVDDVGRIAFLSNGLSHPSTTKPPTTHTKTTETCPYFSVINGALRASSSTPTIVHGPRAEEVSNGESQGFELN